MLIVCFRRLARTGLACAIALIAIGCGRPDSAAKRITAPELLGVTESTFLEYAQIMKLSVHKEDVSGPVLQPGDMKEFKLFRSGFAALSSMQRITEVNLYGPEAAGFTSYTGTMPNAVCWGDSLAAVKAEWGKPKHEEDVAAGCPGVSPRINT